MDNLEKSLHRLSKVNPTQKFCRQAKKRLLYQIELQTNEKWFKVLLKKMGVVMPSSRFTMQARMRIMERIKQPIIGWWIFTKRLLASTLILVLAVTSTLFYIEGQQIVSASGDTYLKVITGKVTIKRGDNLIWNQILGQTELSAGDLIRLDEKSKAIVHFFDDSELRLHENSLILINRLNTSPAYDRQGIIEIALQEGQVWAQSLNVDDGYAGFTIMTRDAIVKTLNGSFDVATYLDQPTTVRIFNHTATVQNISEAKKGIKLSTNKKATVKTGTNIEITELEEIDHIESWVQDNLLKDREHLTALRQREFESLRLTAGTLPGEMLYPIKQAKERLKLAFSFDQEHLTNTQIEIANKRLNEAIVLFKKGKKIEAQEALMAYQSVARQIAEITKENKDIRGQASSQIIKSHQKTLMAALPSDAPIAIVKKALNQTEELFATDPIEREKLRLKNAIERLMNIAELVEVGDMTSAKEAMASHKIVMTQILEKANKITDEAAKEDLFSYILEIRREELQLLNAITAVVENYNQMDPQLKAIFRKASIDAEEEVKRTIAFIKPYMPKVVQRPDNQAPSFDKTAQIFMDKVNIYKTWQGQKNQITRLLKKYPKQAQDVEFLKIVRSQLSPRAQNLINVKILELQRKARLEKHKAVKRKIDRAKSLRRKRTTKSNNLNR